MNIIYYNEYKKKYDRAQELIELIQQTLQVLPYDEYADCEVRLHVCSKKHIKNATGYEGCMGLTVPADDGTYDVYVTLCADEGIFTALHELMHVLIDESIYDGDELFISDRLGEQLAAEYHEEYDGKYATTNWHEYICCGIESYFRSKTWRAAHPKTCKFFRLRGFVL